MAGSSPPIQKRGGSFSKGRAGSTARALPPSPSDPRSPLPEQEMGSELGFQMPGEGNGPGFAGSSPPIKKRAETPPTNQGGDATAAGSTDGNSAELPWPISPPPSPDAAFYTDTGMSSDRTVESYALDWARTHADFDLKGWLANYRVISRPVRNSRSENYAKEYAKTHPNFDLSRWLELHAGTAQPQPQMPDANIPSAPPASAPPSSASIPESLLPGSTNAFPPAQRRGD